MRYLYRHTWHDTDNFQSETPPTDEQLADDDWEIFRISEGKIECWQHEDKYWYEVDKK